MTPKKNNSIIYYNHLIVGICVFSIVMIFAKYTDHRWEDWYITFRASKNLALGNGLVYNINEYYHTFTSPIGTLLPALIYKISYKYANNPDELTLWIFRIINSVILSIGAVALNNIFRNYKIEKSISILSAIFIAFNVLITDFTINGMETAFMVTLIILYIKSITQIRKNKNNYFNATLITLLLLTRPDSIIYIFALNIGFLFFPNNNVDSPILNKTDYFKSMLKSFLIGFIIYSPWLIFTTFYYGTPIPHTITAKGANHSFDLISLIYSFLVKFPQQILNFKTGITSLIFTPPYSRMGSWGILPTMSSFFTYIAIIIPFFFSEKTNFAKMISIAILISFFYLNNVSGQGPMPWYVPIVGIMVYINAIIAYKTMSQHTNLLGSKFVLSLFLTFLLISTVTGAIMIKKQQEIIEFGNRKKIGEYLKQHSKKNQTVFLECLGYIGYYSNMKTYDFPGMSSPEVVEFRKSQKTDDWNQIIERLQPDWLVLRPWEIDRINNKDSSALNGGHYRKIKTFNVRNQIPEILGKNYLEYDAIFILYRINNKE
jgi:hypothetical protein